MFFRQFALVLLGVLVSVEAVRADITEPFDYPEQFDSTGFDDGFGITYRITTTGLLGNANDLVVASWAEGVSAAAGILNDGSNRHATFNSDSEAGFAANETVFLGIADVPGFGDADAGGTFGNFFATPKDLSKATGAVDMRQFTANPTGASARFLAIDEFDNEAWTNPFDLAIGASFTSYGFSANDFVNGDIGFDNTNVIGIGIEFFAIANTSGEISSFQFDVDSLTLNAIPEPSSPPLLGSALILGVCLPRRQRQKTPRRTNDEERTIV